MYSAQLNIISHHVNQYMSQRSLIETMWLEGAVSDSEADRAYKNIWEDAVNDISQKAWVTEIEAASYLLDALAADREKTLFLNMQTEGCLYENISNNNRNI